ncbi:5127_t:CDS:10 [Funneliformis geosporum]|nr:5127_t:CDS:10 [Funneliformis geosporum]
MENCFNANKILKQFINKVGDRWVVAPNPEIFDEQKAKEHMGYLKNYIKLMPKAYTTAMFENVRIAREKELQEIEARETKQREKEQIRLKRDAGPRQNLRITVEDVFRCALSEVYSIVHSDDKTITQYQRIDYLKADNTEGILRLTPKHHLFNSQGKTIFAEDVRASVTELLFFDGKKLTPDSFLTLPSAMFLKWISQLGLLEHDPDTNVLAKFPLNVRKILISEITQTLLSAHDPNLLSSTTHVKWVMEAVGQGFALPLEEMAITSNSKELYSQWLFEPNFRPAAIRDATGLQAEQEFWQTIFHHYSLLYQPRLPSSSVSSVSSTPTTPGFPASANLSSSNFTVLQRHIELCKGVLIVLTMAGRTLGSQFSEETWLVLLKVVLGITDGLLQEPLGITIPEGNLEKKAAANMADELCEHLLRVLFELWLRSKIRNVEMWDIFKRCFNKWTHRQPPLSQWDAATLALTQRVIRLLYGPKGGADMVNISVGGYNVGLDLPTDFVYFAWYRMVYLISNPCILPSANFTLALSGIGKIIESFQRVGQTYDQKSAQNDTEGSLMSIPDGNTLLRMFGSWLFQACSIKRADSDVKQGRAEAYGILCKIFCLPQRREKFLRHYITQFYRALTEGLRTDSCLPVILTNTTSLFATELEGVRMMVPDFVVGIKMILPRLAPGFETDIPLEELRLAAIKIASTIMCLPNHFEKVSLRENWNVGLHHNGDKLVNNDPDEIVINELIRVLYSEEDDTNDKNLTEPFTTLKFYILELLLTSLKTEKSSYNLRYLLHLINVYVAEDVAFCPGLVGLVVKSIQEKILTMNLPSDVTLYAFDVLKDFVSLYEYVQRDKLVLAFSRYIDMMISGSGGGLSITFHLVERAYDCMMRWILIGQWIVGDRDCHEAVIATISRGISITPNNDDESSQSNSPNDKKKNRRDTAPNKLFAPRANKNIVTNNENTSHNGQNRYGKRGEVAVKIAAEIAMAQFVNHLGNFPAWGDNIGPSRISTLFNDDLELAKTQISDARDFDGLSIPELVRYFLIDGRVLVGFVEVPKHPIWTAGEDTRTPGSPGSPDTYSTPTATETPASPVSPGTPRASMSQSYLQDNSNVADSNPSVIIVMRDSTGKYSWTARMVYKTQTDDDNDQKNSSSSTIDIDNYDRILQSTSPSVPLLHTDTTQHTYQDNNCRANVPRIVSFNEHQIPKVDKIFEEGSDSWRAYNAVRKLTQRQKEEEERALEEKQRVKTSHQNYKAIPAGSNTNLESPQAFRLFMSQIGLLSLENRHRMIPLRISEKLVGDLEKLDQLNERDCFSASVYYVRSGAEEYDHIINPPSISEDFEKFLNSLGWPVSLDVHSGYQAKLSSAFCKTAPYFADRTVEVIFNVPYLIHTQSPDSPMESLLNIIKSITVDDLVCIAWVEDIISMDDLPQKIGQSVLVYIFIHPLQNATGLYWIKIVTPTLAYQGGLNEKKGGKGRVSWSADSTKSVENPLLFGPLVDGMIISRHTLGLLVRNTTISAHESCKNFMETHSRSYATRRQFIEEMYHRYKSSLSISE